MKKILLPVLLLLSGHLFAQLAFTNTGNMQLHPGATVSGFGNFTNSSSAVLVNNGSLYLKATVTNDQASLSPGTGTLYLNGTVAQSVNGSATFKTFNLVSDNTAGILLNKDLSIAGAHTFTNGMITSSATPNYLVYENGASYTGADNSRHVNGWVKKNGNGNFTFPVGDATYLRTVAIAGLSASSEFNCHYYRPTQNIYNLWSPLVQVKANEYWQLDKISGGTAQVTLNWEHAKVPMDNILIGDILTAQYSTGNWHSAGGTASGTVTTTGSITSTSINSFGQMTLGYKAFPVPLKLISFTAERRTGTSYLTWITENEENISHFDVQRSYDGVNYTTIGNTTARNLASRQTYFFEDHSPLNGIAYYRIKSIDRDGQFSYSRIAAVNENQPASGNFYTLNPAINAITVFNRSGVAGQFEYRLFSAGGQLVLTGTINMTGNGGAVLPLPPGTAPGIYILELAKDELRPRIQILVAK
ncbi:MAG: hypothetical protein ABIT05_08960 [Chitinophagaceae bacterium]